MKEEAQNPDRRGWLNKLSRWLSAPLLITIVGALLAGYLIPRIASQAEDHRRAREIQASIVQDMSEAVAGVVPVGRLIATGTIKKEGVNTTAAFNDALLDWEADRASIEALLRAYFGSASVNGRTIPDAWVHYADAVHDLYYLSTTQRDDRCERTRQLKKYLAGGDATVTCPNRSLTGKEQGDKCEDASDKWNALALCDEDSLKKEGLGYKRGQNYFDAYAEISDELLKRQEVLLDAVRTTTPSGF
jgi:hypothetical protein